MACNACKGLGEVGGWLFSVRSKRMGRTRKEGEVKLSSEDALIATQSHVGATCYGSPPRQAMIRTSANWGNKDAIRR
jgi:hypothetical protein